MGDKEGLVPIKIKKAHKGLFTKYCKGLGELSVTQACIDKGKKSKNPITKKRTVFADNAKNKWKQS